MAHVSLALFVSAFCLAGIYGETHENLRVTYGHYNNIPLTVSGLVEDSYTLVATDVDLGLDFYTYMGDPRIAIGVDSYGNVAGVRVNLIKADLEKKAKESNLTFPITLADMAMYSQGYVLDTEVYYTTVLFRNPESLKPWTQRLKKGLRSFFSTLLSAAGQTMNSGVLEVEDVYVRLDGGWAVMPKDIDDAPAYGYVKEGCIPGMGTHYFHGMSMDLNCKTWQGLNALYDNGSLIGLVLSSHGYQSVGPNRTWFEAPTPTGLKYIIPNERADCVNDWTEKYGMYSVHIFFNEDPSATKC